MKKFIKKNRKMIIISLTLAIIIAHLLGYTRTYNAFGGEDLIPIVTVFYWILKHCHEQENEKNQSNE